MVSHGRCLTGKDIILVCRIVQTSTILYALRKASIYCEVHSNMCKDPPSSLQISSKIRYQETKPNGRLRRSTGIAIHCEYQPNQISEPCNQGPI